MDAKPRLGDTKPRLGDPEPRLGDPKPRLGDPKPTPGGQEPRLGTPSHQLSLGGKGRAFTYFSSILQMRKCHLYVYVGKTLISWDHLCGGKQKNVYI